MATEAQKKATEAQKRAKAAYRKKNTRITIELYHGTDAELIEYINNQENKSAYIKNLIREDLKKSEKN